MASKHILPFDILHFKTLFSTSVWLFEGPGRKVLNAEEPVPKCWSIHEGLTVLQSIKYMTICCKYMREIQVYIIIRHVGLNYSIKYLHCMPVNLFCIIFHKILHDVWFAIKNDIYDTMNINLQVSKWVAVQPVLQSPESPIHSPLRQIISQVFASDPRHPIVAKSSFLFTKPLSGGSGSAQPNAVNEWLITITRICLLEYMLYL